MILRVWLYLLYLVGLVYFFTVYYLLDSENFLMSSFSFSKLWILCTVAPTIRSSEATIKSHVLRMIHKGVQTPSQLCCQFVCLSVFLSFCLSLVQVTHHWLILIFSISVYFYILDTMNNEKEPPSCPYCDRVFDKPGDNPTYNRHHISKHKLKMSVCLCEFWDCQWTTLKITWNAENG